MRVAILFVSLVVVVFLERAAWYGARASVWPWLADLGLAHEEVRAVMASSLAWGGIGALAGAGVAALVGPHGTLLLTLVGATIVHALLPLGTMETVGLQLGLLGAAYGAVRPALYSAAAGQLAGRRSGLRDALFLCLYVAANLAVGVSTFASGQVWSLLGAGWAIGGTAVFVGLAAIVAALLLGAMSATRAQAEEVAWDGRAAALAGGAVLLALGARFAYELVVARAFEGLYTGGYGGLQQVVMLINPVIVSVVALLTAAALGAASLLGRRVPVLPIAGVGLLLVAAGGMVAAVLPSPVPALVAVVVVSIGEALAIPLLLSRAVGELPWRLSAVAVGLFYAIGAVVDRVGGAIQDLPGREDWGGPVAGVGAGACVVLAVVAIAVGVLVERRVGAEEGEAPAEAA